MRCRSAAQAKAVRRGTCVAPQHIFGASPETHLFGRGDMTALEILRAQHRDVLAVFKRITGGNGNRAALVEEMSGKLRLHSRLEETIVYPALQQHGSKRVQEMVLESYEEHRIVDFLLAQVAPNQNAETEPLLARVRVLHSLVEEHIEEEESEVLKHLGDLDDAVLRQLDERVQAEVDEVERVDELLGRAATVARRTEQWASSLLDLSFGLPRRAVSAIAPSRWLRPDHRYVLAARIAGSVPRVVVDSLYDVVNRRGGRSGRAA
jgi:hypothetical protein